MIIHVKIYIHILIYKCIRSYDFQSVVDVAALVYGFAGCVPLGIWFILRQYEANDLKSIPLITAVCVYGYSLISFIPATVSICI